MTAKKWEHTNRDKRQVDKLSVLEFHFKQWGWLGAEAPPVGRRWCCWFHRLNHTLSIQLKCKMFMKEAQLTRWDRKKKGEYKSTVPLMFRWGDNRAHNHAPPWWVQHVLAGAFRLPSLCPEWAGSALTAGRRVTKDLKLLFKTKNQKAPATPAELHSGSWLVWVGQQELLLLATLKTIFCCWSAYLFIILLCLFAFVHCENSRII